jgi:GAF domain-containing protein
MSAPATPTDELREEVERLRLLHAISLELGASLDFDALVPTVFDRVLAALGAEGGSIWITQGDVLRCRIAVGGRADRLIGAEVPVGTGFVGDVAERQKTTMTTRAQDDPRFGAGLEAADSDLAVSVMATAMVADGVTVGAIQVTDKTGDGVFGQRDREMLEGLAAAAGLALRNAQLHAAGKRAGDLAVLLDISR